MMKVLSQLTTALLLAVSCFLVTGCGDATVETPLDAATEAVGGVVEGATEAVEGATEAGKEAMDKTVEAGKEVMDKTMEAGKEAMSGSGTE